VYDLEDIFGSEGPLASALDEYRVRPQQQALATAVARTLDEGSVLVAEAGTGIGKTFAYLVPALLSGRRLIISTGTRHLQDQLYHRDLPRLRNVLGNPVRTALLKGRSNYFCHYRAGLAWQEAEQRGSRRIRDLAAIRRWSETTRTGDVNEVRSVEEDSPVWPRVTSTVDNCLGQECPDHARCFVLRARREAQDADLVVVNHHLLLADMALKEEGFGELLPGADGVIVDEAHQLPETASQYFGLGVGARQMLELARDSMGEYLRGSGDLPELPRALDGLEKATRDMRLALGAGTQRQPWQQAIRADARAALDNLEDALQRVVELLDPLAERSRGLDNCRRRATELQERLALMGSDEAGDEHVRWVETFSRSFTLNMTPLEFAPRFRTQLEARPCAWVFTSATLSVGASLSHFEQRLGLDEPEELLLDSPFDYRSHACLYLPGDLPDVNTPGYTAALVRAAVPLLEASAGRAFLLFTSYRALREAEQILAGHERFSVLVQGAMPKAALLDRFRAEPEAILLGTSSFWEGVDVKGDALKLVVIDRLPFAAPGDPVLQARLEALRKQGLNPFRDYQLPQAVIALKQGVGRLIRDEKDTGVMMIGDPRLCTKSYGRVFLASLPPMRVTRESGEACDFLAGDVAQNLGVA
jgi:ATP-dependent DNA helicase DinG